VCEDVPCWNGRKGLVVWLHLILHDFTKTHNYVALVPFGNVTHFEVSGIYDIINSSLLL
jgi:hypothetical protein